MEIRQARAADRRDVRRVVADAFGDEGVATLWADVEDRGLARGSLVAVDEGSVVGHVGLSHAWLDARRALVDVVLLGPLSVRPDRQRTGVGTALLAAAVEHARAAGAPLLALEGGPGYYGARGFVPAVEHGIEPASRRTPAPACQVVTFAAHRPWMTGRIVYRDVWWEHDAAGLRDPDLAEVERALGS